MPQKKRTIDRLLVLVVPAGLFIYASTRPLMRLQADMPREFFLKSHDEPTRRVAAEDVARAYWDCAVTVIQWKYSYGSGLPENPPDDFQPTGANLGLIANDPVLRAMYWQRLRKVWALPGVWKRTQVWSTAWAVDPIKNAVRWIGDYVSNLIKAA
jgi:hypothetical protein